MSVTLWCPAAPDLEPLEVNLSNSNAAALLAALGYELPAWELGPLVASDLLTKATAFLGQAPSADEGTPDTDSHEEDPLARELREALRLPAPERTGPREINFGRRPGYLREKASLVASLALAALTSLGGRATIHLG